MSYIYTSAPTYTTANLTLNPNYAVSGSNGYTWTNTATSVTAPVTISQQAKIELKGDDADIVINGESLKDTLIAIESRLAMLKPATELEAEWAELKRLGDEYRKLEKEIQEKTKAWDILKK